MAASLYLVNPRSEMPGYFGAEVFAAWGLHPATSIADLATTTVAASPVFGACIASGFPSAVNASISTVSRSSSIPTRATRRTVPA